ncbi:hypothetical protein [Parapedobacter tibetensis]|uniref:hypothetical protein n=1 Tax=Parapedobacter tibetensis TaxID=2972951 RepID=UPI00214D54BC|nr:hypothetical protein [Parapedobacter tibetensis]
MKRKVIYIVPINVLIAGLTMNASAQSTQKKELDPSKSIKEQLFPDYGKTKAEKSSTDDATREKMAKSSEELIFQNYKPAAPGNSGARSAVKPLNSPAGAEGKLPSEIAVDEAKKALPPSNPPIQLPPMQGEQTKPTSPTTNAKIK